MTSELFSGGCHCGAVAIEVRGPIESVLECNCSMCRKKGTLHWIVSRERFRILRGSEAQTCYQFGTKTAKHFFCKSCGISPYYVPRSHPDKIDVNLRCIDGLDLEAVPRRAFDGQNWERAIDDL